jgi:uroporphyrinogen decarboxylase
MERIQGTRFAELLNGDYRDKQEFFRHYNQFFADMGYDAVSFECCAGGVMPGSGALGGHTKGAIKTRADFEAYPWDRIPDLYFERYRDDFRAFSETLPGGMRGIGGVGNGVFECVQDITGFQELCYMRADDEDLYRALFAKVGDTLARIWARFLDEFGDHFCVCRFGDDLGFKTSTLIYPADIRELIIPAYQRIINLIHRHGKPFLLHSCGCIFEVMDDLIAAGVDAKHSNEDVIAPYSRWLDEYGGKIGNFGGLDTDALCDTSSVDIVAYTTGIYRLCEAKGHGVALGSGNSIPDYVSPERYLLMLETVRTLRKT